MPQEKLLSTFEVIEPGDQIEEISHSKNHDSKYLVARFDGYDRETGEFEFVYLLPARLSAKIKDEMKTNPNIDPTQNVLWKSNKRLPGEKKYLNPNYCLKLTLAEFKSRKFKLYEKADHNFNEKYKTKLNIISKDEIIILTANKMLQDKNKEKENKLANNTQTIKVLETKAAPAIAQEQAQKAEVQYKHLLAAAETQKAIRDSKNKEAQQGYRANLNNVETEINQNSWSSQIVKCVKKMVNLLISFVYLITGRGQSNNKQQSYNIVNTNNFNEQSAAVPNPNVLPTAREAINSKALSQNTVQFITNSVDSFDKKTKPHINTDHLEKQQRIVNESSTVEIINDQKKSGVYPNIKISKGIQTGV